MPVVIVVDSIEALDEITKPEVRVEGRVAEWAFLSALELIRESRFVAPLTMELKFTDGKASRSFTPAEFMPAILKPYSGAGLSGELCAALMDNDDRLARQFVHRILGDGWDFEGITRKADRVSIKSVVRGEGQRILARERTPLLSSMAVAWIYLAVRDLRLRKMHKRGQPA